MISQPALIHSHLFMARAFYDVKCGYQGYGDEARYHLAQTLRHLRSSLDDTSEAGVTHNVVVVVCLALASTILGEFATAKKHVEGLARVCELQHRDPFSKVPILKHKAMRIDFGLALLSGSQPYFSPDKRTTTQPDNVRLRGTWELLQELSHLGIAGKLGPTYASIPHRLLTIGPFEPGSMDELQRLSMLAWLKTVLLGVRGIERHIQYFSDQLKMALLLSYHSHMDSFPHDHEAARMFLWALFVAMIATNQMNFSEEEAWISSALQEVVTVLDLRTWEDVHAALAILPWIGPVFDEPAKVMYEKWMVSLR